MYDQSDIFFVQDTAKVPFVLSWYGILFILLIWLLSMTDYMCLHSVY